MKGGAIGIMEALEPQGLAMRFDTKELSVCLSCLQAGFLHVGGEVQMQMQTDIHSALEERSEKQAPVIEMLGEDSSILA